MGPGYCRYVFNVLYKVKGFQLFLQARVDPKDFTQASGTLCMRAVIAEVTLAAIRLRD